MHTEHLQLKLCMRVYKII